MLRWAGRPPWGWRWWWGIGGLGREPCGQGSVRGLQQVLGGFVGDLEGRVEEGDEGFEEVRKSGISSKAGEGCHVDRVGVSWERRRRYVPHAGGRDLGLKVGHPRKEGVDPGRGFLVIGLTGF